MNKGKIKAYIITILCVTILAIVSCFCITNDTDKKEVVEKAIEGITEINKYAMTDEQIKELPTTEIKEQTEEQEKEVSETQATIETEGFEEQGEIAYNGTSEYPNVALGEYKGLTYYSQIDNRWRNHPYTSIGDYSQTIGTSGCRSYMCKYGSNSNKRNNNSTRHGRFIC